MDKSIWIHIGFPKCASTALQKDFFSQCPEIDYVGRWKNWTLETKAFYTGTSLKIASLADRYYEQKQSSIIEDIFSQFNRPEASIRLVSDEGLLGGSRPCINSVPLVDVSQVARRLSKIFPEGHVLMIIRNQLKFIPSYFGQIVALNEKIDIDPSSFLSSHFTLEKAGQGNFFHVCDYSSIYESYEEFFGEDRVHVLLLEDLAEDALAFMTRLIDLLGLTEKVNPKDYTPQQHNTRIEQKLRVQRQPAPSVLRLLGQFAPVSIRRKVREILRGPQFKTVDHMDMSDEHMEFFNTFYGPGNRKLQAKLGGTRLADTGYPMGKSGTN